MVKISIKIDYKFLINIHITDLFSKLNFGFFLILLFLHSFKVIFIIRAVAIEDSVSPAFLEPFRENSFIKVQADGITGFYEVIENALHVAMGTQGLSDVASEAIFSDELDGAEVIDVSGGEEHVTDHRLLLFDFEGVAGEDYAL